MAFVAILKGTTYLGLFYQPKKDATLVGYADAGYMSVPHKAKSQIGYSPTEEQQYHGSQQNKL